nr:sigma-70 family RNA polymerase sigma factor [bacterium]
MTAGRERDQLICNHLALCTAMAARHRVSGVEWEDLLQAARCGLIEAAARYQADKGSFATYAVPWIQGELRALLRARHAVHMPRQAVHAAGQLGRAQAGGKTVREVAREMNLSPEECAALEGATHAACNIDEIAIPRQEEGFERLEDRMLARQMLDRLSQEERQAVQLVILHNMTGAQAARVLGKSQVQISRLVARATARLRHLAAGVWDNG